MSPGFLIQGGKLIGGNLFHSFSTFNLGTGDTANFVAPSSSVTNIFARVTGGPSSIDGTITSSLGINGPLSKSNLFFINPEGVMFTSNAQINLGGSFVVSTANYVNFTDGSTFFADTNHPINDAGLSSAPVSAFGFINPTTQPGISFTGSTFTAPEGQGIHVLGGDVSLNNAKLLAPSGYVSIFSAASSGEVPFNLTNPKYSATTNTSFGNVTLQNSSYVGIDGAGGGKIVIRGGILVVDNSVVSSANSGSVPGGDISVEAARANVQNYGSIQTSTSGTGSAGNVDTKVANLLTVDGGYIGSTSTSLGNAGNISVQTGSLVIEDTASLAGTGIFSSLLDPGILSQSNGALILGGGPGGNAGNVSVTVGGELSITTGNISSNTYTTGNAGNINAQAGSLSIDGSYPSGISSRSFGAQSSNGAANGGAGGTAGAINVSVAGNISIANGGTISSSTNTTGLAGDVNVKASSLVIDGVGALGSPGIYSESFGASTSTGIAFGGAGGNGGAVNVSVMGSISIKNGGLISSTTFTTGNAGDVTVTARSLYTDDSTENFATGITSDSDGAVGSSFNPVGGPGGSGGKVIVIVAENISITNGAEISTDTFTTGNAGNVSVTAGSLYINDPVSPYDTGILSQSDGAQNSNGYSIGGVGGNAGTVNVSVAGAIYIANTGTISSSISSTGSAGTVNVEARSLVIDGSGAPYSTGIISQSYGAQNSNGFSIGGVGGNSGTVNVSVSGNIFITNGGEISSSTNTTGNAGNVNVQATSLNIAVGSLGEETGIVSESDGAQDSNGNILGGTGGNAGTVHVTTSGLTSITSSGEISSSTFTTGNAGTVTVNAGSLNIDSSNSISETGIFSQSQSVGTGNAGEVSANVAGNISLTNGGEISSRTYTAGNAGDVMIQANQVSLVDGIIDSESQGTGTGGSVKITANDVDLRDNSQVSSSSMISNGGSVEMNIGDTLALYCGSSISTSSATNGGDITLKVGKLVYFLDSQISAAAGDNGGNILIDPEFVVLDNSKITANAAAGQGGNITIITDYYLNENSQITATGTTSGTIDISAPDLDLGGAMVGLPAALVSAEKRLKERCAISIRYEFSTLTVVGRGGTETQPEELQPDFGAYSGSEKPEQANAVLIH